MSDETKHTPGARGERQMKWTYRYGYHHGEPISYEIEEGREHVATMILSGDEAKDETRARLIAAAPEMLEALERIAAWIGCNAFPAELHHLDELRALHAAIAKAKGGNQ